MNDQLLIALDDQQVAKARGVTARLRQSGLVLRTVVFISFVFLIVTFATYQSGGLVRAIPYLLGQRVFVQPLIEIGHIRCGVKTNVAIEVFNSDSGPIKIVGSEQSCSCINLEPFPIEVRSGGVHHLQLSLKSPSKESDFMHSIQVFVIRRGSTETFPVVIRGIASDSY